MSTSQSRETNTKSPQELRLRLKREAVALGARMEAFGARAELGRVTPHRASIEVRQLTRLRQTIDVEIEADEPVYLLEVGGVRVEMHDADAVRRAVVAPPSRSTRLWEMGVVLVAWILIAIGVAVIWRNDALWLVVGGTFLAGVALTFALGALLRRGRRRRIQRASAARLAKKR